MRKVLIVDDHPVTRTGVRAILEADNSIEIIGEARDGKEAVDLTREKTPDIVVMDISMPQLSGIDATREILSHQPDTKIIALSIHSGEKFVKEMLDAGAQGYLLKEEAPEELIRAIKKINRGEMYLSSAVTRAALNKDEVIQDVSESLILQSKLYRPRLTPDFIRRSEIIQELERNVGNPISLVSAGAGYGKSICVSQWLEQTEYLHAWISLDPDHNEIRLFLYYLVAAVDKIFPGTLKETYKIASSINLPTVKEISDTLINELCNIELDFILVLDDYHTITNNQIHELLNGWLLFPPPNIHLCIITRRDPPLKLEKLRMAGRMKDIRMNALGFKRDEIRELFHQIRHIDLDAHSIEFIENKTEGWIIALRLASMIIMEKKDVEQAFKTIETDKSTISEYLVMEVLSKQPADIRKAMLISSLFDRFNENLLDNLLTEGIETNGRELINWLRKSNLFIIDLDQKGEWYRYHHLFKSILYEKLTKQTTKKDLRQMHRKASHWFENNKFLSEAMDHAIACDDVNLSTGIVKRNRLELLNGNIYYQLEQLQGRIPMSVIESDAELLLIELYIQWNHGNFPRLGELEALLDQLMDTVDKASPIHSESLFFIGFNSLFLRQDLGAAMKYFNEAMELVPESSAEPRGMLELHYFIFGQLAGLYDMLHKMYYELMDKDLLPQRKNRINQGFFAASIDQAILSEVLKNAHDAISFADTMNMKDSRGIIEDFTGAAKLRIGEKKEALELFNNVLEDRYYVHSRIVIDSLTGIIIINCVSNNMTKADETFSILESYIENLDEFFNSMVWSVRIRYQMFLRNHETVRELLKEYKPGVLDLVLWLDVPEITHAWALIYEGSDESLEQAEKELEQLEAMCSALQNRIHLYEVKVLQAILFGLKGETENAEEALSASLEIAEPEGMYLYYVELGNMFESLIDGLSEKTRTRPFIVKVLLQIRKIQEQPAEKTPPTKKRKMNMLTQREIEVLNCISEGLRNKEIAEKLFNSEETIKKHIYNMFQKLQVKNRMNLVSKAREEGLLAE